MTREYSHHLTEIGSICQGRKMEPTNNKKNIKKMAQDPDCIPGIYNYCDRWCERCPFTSLLRLFRRVRTRFCNSVSRLLHQEEKSLSIVTFIKHLGDRAEKEFPEARSFIRPGFDEAAVNDRSALSQEPK